MGRKRHNCQIKGQLNIFTLFREKCQFSKRFYCTYYVASHYKYLESGKPCDEMCCYSCKEKDLCGYACNACKEIKQKPQYQKAPRYSWDHYGITKERYKQLTEYIQSGKYDDIASQAAQETNKDIAEYILLSVTKDKSYDELQKKWELREIERIPCCRTDFYGYRRYFYHIFDEMIKESNILGKSDGEQYLTGQKIRGFSVYSQIPEGWEIDSGAITAPKGYVIISNCESRFGGKRKTGLTAVVGAKGD